LTLNHTKASDISPTAKSIRRDHHCKRHLDEIFALVDRLKGATGVAADLSRLALLNPTRELHTAASRASLFSLILNSREGSSSELSIANPP
jgi:hypothetical protein